jgi:hypothetical protein
MSVALVTGASRGVGRVEPDVLGDPAIDVVCVIIVHVPRIALAAVVSLKMPKDAVAWKNRIRGIGVSG